MFNINNVKSLKDRLVKDDFYKRGQKNSTGFDGFDLIISIEMFEHMKNYKQLLGDISNYLLKPSTGKLFVEVFVHKSYPYHFEATHTNDWMSKYFFTGGTMPSYDLLPIIVDKYQNDIGLNLLYQWKVNGIQYSYTSEVWLKYMDDNETDVRIVLGNIYGTAPDIVEMWWNRWRVFFLSVAEFFKYDQGNEWFVAHYLFQKQK